MALKMRGNVAWIAVAFLAAAAASCGGKPPSAGDRERRLPEIQPNSLHMELLSTPGREISLDAPEIVFRNALGTHVTQRLYEADFAELERLAAIYRGGMLTGSGIEKLGPFYWAFIQDMIVDRDGVDKKAPDLISAWANRYPMSPTPYIATAFMYDEVARRMESNGDAPAGRERKQRFRDEALRSLTTHWDLVRADPYAHGMKMRLISAGAASDETWEEAFEAAKREHSRRFVIYFEAVNSAPGMSDSPLSAGIAAERIARALADTMGEDGDAGYARVWWSAYSRSYIKYLFENGWVNWPRIRSGFYKIIEDYPEPWNLNNFARFSCIVGDVKTLRSLAPAVREHPIDDVWTYEHREYCFLFADATAEEIPLESP